MVIVTLDGMAKLGAIDLRIDELLLDAANPRFTKGGGQREVLQKILEDQNEKLFALAENIVNDGMNPMDRLLVMSSDNDPGKYIALEGNRRVAALKILANPNILTGMEIRNSLRQRFEKLAKDFQKVQVEPIAGFEVPNRKTGTPWILLRHTGENEGRGVVSWSGLAASRFRGSEPALQALDFVKNKGNLTVAEKGLIESTRYPITTLDRLLSSRDVRQKIGLDVKASKLVSELPPVEIMKPLRRMVLDLATKRITVSDLKDTASQVKYVDSFDAASKPNFAKKVPQRDIEAISTSEFRLRIRPLGAKKSQPDPFARKTVVPRGTNLSIQDRKLLSIFKELKTLRVEDARNAIAVLLRVFLELSIDNYMARHRLPTKFNDPKSGKQLAKRLSRKLADVLDHVTRQPGVDRKNFLAVTRSLNDLRSPLHIDLLHAYIHNRFVIPKPHDLISAWDDAEPLLQKIWP